MADNQEKKLTLSQGEVVALKKAIMYLKFSCEETESVMYAGSPLINSIFSKLIELDDLGQQSIDFYNKGHAGNERFVLAKLDKLELENGREFQSVVKESSFRECLFPFSRK
ncbi:MULTISPECIES: hypothetical protein [Enterobacteriaceae]|uniref:hypothetical protein n=1 Tax=Enterobacteriaceae TaxID=543 RepID=UPI0005894563|nr:hypothetical protein [Enterobacter cloacae]ELK7336101.1 hypothetical protein [Enterobacter cloacae]ELV2845769.1 hypothetical protein [Enterobacter cloacae]KIF93760.1 hypothetical protein SD66_22615 [Enterobacter cloacae]KZP59866.1 hypothetical protein A3N40_11505 [Enterobacter cloacae subsp. dissolvens]MCK7269377.1 hypothetical protein [Enterobacter cloacae]